MQTQSLYGLNALDNDFDNQAELGEAGTLPENGLAGLINQPFGVDQGLGQLNEMALSQMNGGSQLGANGVGSQNAAVGEVSGLLGEIAQMLPGLMNNQDGASAGNCDGANGNCGQFGGLDGYDAGSQGYGFNPYDDGFNTGNDNAGTPGFDNGFGGNPAFGNGFSGAPGFDNGFGNSPGFGNGFASNSGLGNGIEGNPGFGNGMNYGGEGGFGANAQPQYSSFNASSTGDPHDAFNGTTQNGRAVSDKWDNMQSHGDLLNSSSFRGGFDVSSKATQPNANGITENGQVDVRTAGGRNDIEMNANGNASVEQNGRWSALSPGTNMTLSDGTTVSDGTNNVLTINKTNNQGGNIQTTLSANGQGGVDVQASGSNISLGGYLANQGTNGVGLG